MVGKFNPLIVNPICEICLLPIPKKELFYCKNCGCAYHFKCLKKKNFHCIHCGSTRFVRYETAVASVDSRPFLVPPE